MNKVTLESILKEPVRKIEPLAGGCIANTQKITTEPGRTYAVKQSGQEKMFYCEANGLKELAKAKAIKVPEVIHVDDYCLILEFINEGRRSADFFKSFGKALAELHQYKSDKFGFYENNFIGSTPQINIPEGDESSDWVTFYSNRRLLFQFTLAEKNGYVDSHFRKLFNHLITNLPEILAGSEESPALLHGDLWSGNYMTAENGEAAIIDPAVYYGHREAELAMTRLFGGFENDFYNSYNETYPLKPGFEYREGIYTLYHVLNHLNLFGTGYLGHAISLMQQYKD